MQPPTPHPSPKEMVQFCLKFLCQFFQKKNTCRGLQMEGGNEFQLEKIEPIFSSLSPCVLENSLKHLIWFILSLKIHQISSLQCSYFVSQMFAWPILLTNLDNHSLRFYSSLDQVRAKTNDVVNRGQLIPVKIISTKIPILISHYKIKQFDYTRQIT